MTDEELAKCLRDLGMHSAVVVADRIEQLTAQLAEDADARALVDDRLKQLVAQVDALTAERDEAINQLDSAIHSQIVLEKRTAAVMEDRRLIVEERDRTFALMLARAEAAEAERDRAEDELYELQQTCITLRGKNEALTAERDRLRAELADAAVALDDAGDELSELANVLSQDPHAANLAYTSACTARAALKVDSHE